MSNSEQNDMSDDDRRIVAEVQEIIRGQLGDNNFETLEVTLNPTYPGRLPTEPYAVVPFQVRASNQTGPIVGIAPTGRSSTFEGVALRNPGGDWEFFADSLCLLTDLGIQITFRAPLPQAQTAGQGGGVVDPVPSTSAIAQDQEKAADG